MNKRTVETRACSEGRMTRYFLRWLAIARRRPRNSDPSNAYFDAILEVASVALGAPLLGSILFVGIATMDVCAPNVGATVGPIGTTHLVLGALLFSTLVAVIGYLWLNPKYRKYADDPSMSERFDNQRERRIAYVQKYTALLFFGIFLPFLGLIVLVGPAKIFAYYF